jgi:hypothetical protein
MHRSLSTVLVLAWGLWFGAIVMVFIAVISLFATFADQRGVAGAAAAGIFRRFEALQVVAACAALAAALTLYFRAPQAGRRPVVPMAIFVATVGALASATSLTPQIEALRRAGVASTSEQFKSLHRRSSTLYAGQAALLLATGLFLPGFLKRTDTSAATAPA